ncbi:capsular polysaccharide synthesis protein [Enterococcus faecium]|nr:capsular polysaccharide synthesis protein [Enterococcus faecium]
MKIKKIKEYIKKGTIFSLLRYKVSVFLLKKCTHNKNLAVLSRQCIVGEKLKKEFSYVLENKYKDPFEGKSNKVWFCWFQGYDAAPELIKACYHAAKQAMPNKEIIFLTGDNINSYVHLPDYITEKYHSGKIGFAHYSDLIRISLLCEYGGLWIDSTVLTTSPEMAEYITSLPFFVFKQLELTRLDYQPTVASNWLISSYSNNKILLLTRDFLYEYWKKYNYAIDYFIFHIFFRFATEKYREDWENVPTFNNISPHMLQMELNSEYNEERWKQLLLISGFHKLNHHIAYNRDNTFLNMSLIGISLLRRNHEK